MRLGSASRVGYSGNSRDQCPACRAQHDTDSVPGDVRPNWRIVRQPAGTPPDRSRRRERKLFKAVTLRSDHTQEAEPFSNCGHTRAQPPARLRPQTKNLPVFPSDPSCPRGAPLVDGSSGRRPRTRPNESVKFPLGLMLHTAIGRIHGRRSTLIARR
jgi:hypothetical protein